MPNKGVPKNYCWLLDGRAGKIAHDQGHGDLSKKGWGRYILVGGYSNEICRYANEGDYGDDCVVANNDGIIMFEWFADEKWTPKKTPSHEHFKK